MPLRTFTVLPREAGQGLVAWLARKLARPEADIRIWIRGRKVRVAGQPCSNPAWRVRAGQRVEVEVPSVPDKAKAKRKPTVSEANPGRAGHPPIHLQFIDEHILIVEKPPGLTTMRHAGEAAEFGTRARKYLPTTLQDLLPALVATHTQKPPGRIRAVHRLDKETSGLVVFARSAAAESALGSQFRAHTIERIYRAIVRGQAVSARIESTLVADRGDGRRGSGPGGQRAVTHVTLLENLGDFSLVECRLETGRTHQVRIHLGEAGTPLCGERVYDRPLHGKPYPDGSGIERVALHAATLGLDHPITGKRMHWSAALPADLDQALKRLRKAVRPS
jgi:23S rRNA pseudouridine1911/1915/1917 synthase